MAKNTKESNSAPIKNVESTLTTTEQFLESHYKELLIGLGVVVLLIGIFWVGRIYLGKQDDEAKSQMYQAEKYFEMDSLNLAIAGSLRNGENFTAMKTAVAAHPFTCIPTPGDIGEIHHFLHTRRDFLLRLLENPVLLEHQGFTSLLQATFHLAEELGRRGSFEGLPGADPRHLAGDISRVYGQLAGEWVRYIAYLNRNYPYLYSLAVRTNPFDPGASVIIPEK